MPDREKVIKALEDALMENKYSEIIRFSHEVVEIIIALLKEQQREIEIMKAMGLKMPEITVLTDKPIYKVDT